MFNRHNHNFKIKGLSLYCSCGKTQRILCKHTWELTNEVIIKLRLTGAQQNVQYFICTNCGATRSLNAATGEELYHDNH